MRIALILFNLISIIVTITVFDASPKDAPPTGFMAFMFLVWVFTIPISFSKGFFRWLESKFHTPPDGYAISVEKINLKSEWYLVPIIIFISFIALQIGRMIEHQNTAALSEKVMVLQSRLESRPGKYHDIIETTRNK